MTGGIGAAWSRFNAVISRAKRACRFARRSGEVTRIESELLEYPYFLAGRSEIADPVRLPLPTSAEIFDLLPATAEQKPVGVSLAA